MLMVPEEVAVCRRAIMTILKKAEEPGKTGEIPRQY